MTLIDNLTEFADQVTTLILDDGSVAEMELRFCAAAQRWVMNITYNGVAYNGIGLCDHPNILRQWSNVLPFGIACVTADQTDPFDINDFATGRVLLYLLNAADVVLVNTTIFGVPA